MNYVGNFYLVIFKVLSYNYLVTFSMDKKLIWVVERYIKNTPRKGYVKDLRIKVGEIPHKLRTKVGAKDSRVYVTTKSLKHMYDARLAQEFDFIIANIEFVINDPQRIYKNKEGKTGDVCLYCELEGNAYFYILDNGSGQVRIVSAYRLSAVEEKRRNYLSGYKLLWSRKGDLPSS